MVAYAPSAPRSDLPWSVSTNDPHRAIDAYLPLHGVGQRVNAAGQVTVRYYSGQYTNGTIVGKSSPAGGPPPSSEGYLQTLDLQKGELTTTVAGKTTVVRSAVAGYEGWQRFWSDADITIGGDPEAQQATRAELFYLAGSASPTASIPPFGLSSDGYRGHIFWDAETWMFPALVVQHPNLARGILKYRFDRLAQAKAIAAAEHLPGADYPWESAATGKEEAPLEFSQERHITADIAFAAWQYYLWTGDKQYLASEGWPIIRACADYWAARATKGADGKYHILKVIGPDETSGVVDDDAWTNAVVAETLRDADAAAAILGQQPGPAWVDVASKMTLLRNPSSGLILEHAGATDTLRAKQADTQLLLYPLKMPMPEAQAAATLAYVQLHTIAVGPAMTSSINALIAARLGLAQESLDLFRPSYEPFLRDPWDAFSEKKTRDNVYFCTGMGGCLQTVLYGFAGLNVVAGTTVGHGKLLARSNGAALYADPHLPPGWTNLTVHGIRFRGQTLDLSIAPGNKATVARRKSR